MKAKLFIYVLLLSNFSFGQTQVLLDNTWYLEKFVINGSDITYTDNTSYDHIIGFQVLDNNILLASSYCLTMFGLNGNVSNNIFTYDGFYQLGVPCQFSSDDLNMFNVITTFYLLPNNDFTFTITDVNNYKKLIFVNPQGNSAIYNNVNLNVQSSNIVDKLTTYPNPVENILHFKSDFEISKIKIFALDGKLIDSNLSFSGNQIDFSNLKSGIYFLEFEQDGQVTRKKVVKR
ncbi:MAG: T9SS type A sorting domain-containing protein [Flavobacteriales bacterium]|nr:T9SS type A sorting domain-containing protein [Flavobacteriales bacterium]